MKKRVGERIQEEISEFYANEVLLPTTLVEYDQGFKEMILLNKAHAIMLLEAQIIEKQAAVMILEGLDRVWRELKRDDLDGAYEELYFNVQKFLFDRVGVEMGGKLHTGRSRNDIYAVLTRMEVRRSLWEVMQRVIDLQQVLTDGAAQDLDTVITGYTHRMPAQPITIGHFYLGVFSAFHRDFIRLQNAYRCTNISPYGSAALAGTGFAINRQRQCELLGFEKLLINSLDGVGARDFVLEAEAAFAIMMSNLSRVAQDLYVWSGDEYGVYVPGAPVSLISSIMPQKKNPDSLEMAEGKAGHALGSFVSAFSAIKNTPFSFSQDLLEASVMYWEGHSQTLQALGLLCETIKCSAFNRQRARHLAKNNFSTITALADFLVQKFKIPFWQAHDILGDMVRRVHDSGRMMDGLTSGLLKEVAQEIFQLNLNVDDEEIQTCLDPAKNVQAKISEGSPGRKSVEQMLSEANGNLSQEKNWLQKEMQRVESAYQQIDDVQSSLTRA
ncbi:MAG: argininosuccinate lyase [Desulfobacterales bacterium]|nr:MAG: argininosuccinate lyase [Desulfobacterales bacterium]